MPISTERDTFAAAVRHPQRAIRVLLALLKGQWCRISCRIRGVRFEAGKNLRVFGTLSVRGPGLVRFGRNVVVDMTVTPWTYDPRAVIDVGDDVFLNGARFGCAERIAIGPLSMVGESSLLDTNFHSTSSRRREQDAFVRVAPVELGANVWVAAGACVLPGTRIGNNSVVGFGAVCSGDYPGDVVIAAPRATVVRQLR
jgi:acetyltransferase-like isoleucine patch superfamily enzyme